MSLSQKDIEIIDKYESRVVNNQSFMLRLQATKLPLFRKLLTNSYILSLNIWKLVIGAYLELGC